MCCREPKGRRRLASGGPETVGTARRPGRSAVAVGAVRRHLVSARGDRRPRAYAASVFHSTKGGSAPGLGERGRSAVDRFPSKTIQHPLGRRRQNTTRAPASGPLSGGRERPLWVGSGRRKTPTAVEGRRSTAPARLGTNSVKWSAASIRRRLSPAEIACHHRGFCTTRGNPVVAFRHPRQSFIDRSKPDPVACDRDGGPTKHKARKDVSYL